MTVMPPLQKNPLSSIFPPLNISTATLGGIGRCLFHFFLKCFSGPDDVEEKAVDAVDLLLPVNTDITVQLGLIFDIALGYFCYKDNNKSYD